MYDLRVCVLLYHARHLSSVARPVAPPRLETATMAETDVCKFSGSLGGGNTPSHEHEHGHTHEHLEHAGTKEMLLP
jgi:hypothetical protein